MCGIYFSILINASQSSIDEIREEVQYYLLKRGPDGNDVIFANNLIFSGFVLWQQGEKKQSQPATNDSLILLFNGDVFNDTQRNLCISDTTWMLNEITKCKNDGELCKLFKDLQGPFSIIFYNKGTKDLYFARDSLGRNSLIIERDDNFLRISSTTCLINNDIGRNCIELPPLGIYKINICSLQLMTIYPWIIPSKEWCDLAKVVKSSLQMAISFDNFIEPIWLQKICQKETYNFYKMVNISYSTIDDLFLKFLKNQWLVSDLCTFSKFLEKSVKERVTKTKNACTNCLTGMINECNHSKIGILFSGGIDCTILAVIANKYVDSKDSIDLINVAFETPTNNWNVPDRNSASQSFSDLKRICPHRRWKFIEVNISRDELYYSMEHHIKHLIYPLKTVLDESIGGAFWFASRGIGIYNRRLHKSSVRDRDKENRPIEVPSELVSCEEPAPENPASSRKQVIIVGSGADELFGGYTRHRNTYRRTTGSAEDKQNSVHCELDRDWNRMHSRNLGRDDRVIADNGKTSRTPFIEENIVKFVQSKSAGQRCCFLLEEGVGDKLFLRLYGYTLGIGYAVRLKKRAIQFGSRIAKKNQNANDLSCFICK